MSSYKDIYKRIKVSDYIFKMHKRQTYITVILLVIFQILNLILALFINNNLINAYIGFVNVMIYLILIIHIKNNSKAWNYYSDKIRNIDDEIEKEIKTELAKLDENK